MHHRRAGKVVEALSQRGKKMSRCSHQCQEAVRSPCPMSNNRIDKSRDGHAVQQVSYKAGAANHRSGSNRGAGVRESKLEHPESQERNAGSFISRWSIFQKEPVIPDKTVAVAEHEGKANRVEQ